MLLLLGTPSLLKAYAQYTCEGEIVDDFTSNAISYSENTQWSSDGKKRFFRFTPSVSGEVTVMFSSSYNHRLEIGTSCDHGEIYYGSDQTSDTHTFSVTAGTEYFVNIKERNHLNYLYFTVYFSTVVNQAPVAQDDSVSAPQGQTTSVDVLANDSDPEGETLSLVSVSAPARGSAVINGTTIDYTPEPGFAGEDRFGYTIQDASGNTASATVTVTVPTVYASGNQPFVLVNPPKTRNIIGNYVIAGNTVECVTDQDSNYNGTCMNIYAEGSSIRYDNNNKITRYIDIDGNNDTWNSSASNFELPGASSIAWAGLFWQGNINNRANTVGSWSTVVQRRAKKASGGSGYVYDVDIGQYTYSTPDVDLTQTDGNRVLLAIDGGGYEEVTATTFYYKDYYSSGAKGGFYGAYADVTSLLQRKNLQAGGHTATVANITTNEGHESYIGNFGGWTLVVIYTEHYLNAKARNISIYNGYAYLTTSEDVDITVSGFKLPKKREDEVTETVHGKYSAFAGEGEQTQRQDRMWMKHTANSDSDAMPGAADPENIFDAHLTNISRDAGNDNAVENTNAVDIDDFNISSIVTGYRDADPATDTLHIGLSTGLDVFIPSMVALSFELYQPEVCYDYAIRRNNQIIPYSDQEGLYGSEAQIGDEVSFTVGIRSLEGDDIVLDKVSVVLSLDQTEGNLTLIRDPDKAYYSHVNSGTMVSTDYADLSTDGRPVITIGKGRTDDIGGTVSSNERYFSRFHYRVADRNETRIGGRLTIEVNASLNFGSGEFWQMMKIDRCPQNPIYTPAWYGFNVERVFPAGAVPADATLHYSLPTRIAGRDFHYAVAAYTQDSDGEYTVAASDDNVTVDVELINIGAFDDNGSYFKCANPNPSIIMMPGRFVHFSGGARRIDVVDADDLNGTYPVRNATFRMWLLIDSNGTIITDPGDHNKSDNNYFASIYQSRFQAQDDAGFCSNACTPPYEYSSPRSDSDAQAVGCYACLRDYFAQPICARDNFAIRPKAFRVQYLDNDTNASASPNLVVAANSERQTLHAGQSDNQVALIAGYPYVLSITAVDDTDSPITRGYYSYSDTFREQEFSTAPTRGIDARALLQFVGSNVACADTNHSAYHLNFSNGQSSAKTVRWRNAGHYRFGIWDAAWTKVDQAYNNPYKTTFSSSCINSASEGCNDCLLSRATAAEDSNEKVGCSLDSDLASDSNYTDINITYHPDHFSVGMLTLTTQPRGDNTRWLYMSDLNRSIAMSAEINGTVTAEGFGGNSALSNYRQGCAANDVIVRQEHNTTGESGGVPLQYRLLTRDVAAPSGVVDADDNFTISAALFGSNGDANGSASFVLYYNFKKPLNRYVNVVDVNFTAMHAAESSGDAIQGYRRIGYIPGGDGDLNVSRYFYFARIVARDADGFWESNATRTEGGASHLLNLYVDIFCESNATIGLDCSALPGVSSMTDANSLLYRASRAGSWSSLVDGRIHRIDRNDTVGNRAAIVSNANILFGNDAGTATLAVNYLADALFRPETVVGVIDPDPWLLYDANRSDGRPSIRIRFIINRFFWKGEGEVGHVIDIPNAGRNIRTGW
jgi:hypothetical protein